MQFTQIFMELRGREVVKNYQENLFISVLSGYFAIKFRFLQIIFFFAILMRQSFSGFVMSAPSTPFAESDCYWLFEWIFHRVTLEDSVARSTNSIADSVVHT